MDAVQMLKADHDTVKGLFRAFEAVGKRAQQKKQRLGDQILQELAVHAALEEEIFSPAIQATAPTDLPETVAEGIEEHHVVHVLIGELRALHATDEAYSPTFTMLIENVEHHIDEEEGEILPRAQERRGKDVKALGEHMAARKQEREASQRAEAGKRASLRSISRRGQ